MLKNSPSIWVFLGTCLVHLYCETLFALNCGYLGNEVVVGKYFNYTSVQQL